MKTTRVFIDFSKLMKQTDNGRAIYELIVPNLHKDGDDRYKKTFNPLYQDTQPDLSIFKGKSGCWRHRDHGDSSFSGDSIDLASGHYNLDRKSQFALILEKLVDDLQIAPELVAIRPDSSSFIEEWWTDEEGMDAAYNYFAAYGISRKILRRYGVRAVKKYPIVDDGGELRWRYFPKDKITIAYQEVNHTKLYTPGADKQFKFSIVGSKPPDFIFGMGQILTNIRHTRNYDRGPLIITGGEKDVLTLTALGYDAITLNSETACLPSHVEDFMAIYNKVIVLYDIDDTGKKQAARLAIKHKLAVCTLPEELLSKGGKDISDYVKLGMPIDELRKLIEDSSTPDSLAAHQNAAPAFGTDETDTLITTPLLPEEIYTLLPETLKDICHRFPNRREKDICLLSCLTVLSTCFPKVKGIYDDRRIGCNFNLFITAPASAGKGVMTWSRLLGNNIDRYLNQRYKAQYREYEVNLAAFDPASGEEHPEPPKFPMFFIPANSSTSSIYECVDANQNFGIMLDSEGDTLSSTMKNDWADFSSLIRKSFHHEFADMKRRTNNEYRKIEKPHMSILLTGTRNQVTRLIDSVENGLFSRFAFYDVELNLPWDDKFGNKDSDMEAFFDLHGLKLLEYWKKCELSEDILCLIDQSDRETIFKYFSHKLQWLYSIHGENIVANVRRTCVIYYRIAMILTALNFFERVNLSVSKVPKQLMLNRDQSRCAHLIVDTLLHHLEFVFSRIQTTGGASKLNGKQRSLFDALPKEFSWQDFLSAASEVGITNAAAQKYRRDFISAKLIKSLEHAKYRKI